MNTKIEQDQDVKDDPNQVEHEEWTDGEGKHLDKEDVKWIELNLRSIWTILFTNAQLQKGCALFF